MWRKPLDILDPGIIPQKNGHTSEFSQKANRIEGNYIGTEDKIKRPL